LAIEATKHGLGLITCVATTTEITQDEFFRDYIPRKPEIPLYCVSKLAKRLALFALTIGEQVSKLIREKEHAGDYAIAFTLDALASLITERAVAWLSRSLLDDPSLSVLAYSPGYCGWGLTYQKPLFERVRPANMTLSPSFLMSPLKSCSGVLVYGERNIHGFKPEFVCCGDCRTFACRARIRSVLKDGHEPLGCHS
jgi:hypothetical protein